MAKQVIKITENELHNLIKESIKIITERNYRDSDKRRKVAQHLNGKTTEQKKEEWNDIFAKRAAIRDINRDRDWEHMSPHDREFSHSVNHETFNINFNDLDDYDYVSYDDKYLNESFWETHGNLSQNKLSPFGSDVDKIMLQTLKQNISELQHKTNELKVMQNTEQIDISFIAKIIKDIKEKINIIHSNIEKLFIPSRKINMLFSLMKEFKSSLLENNIQEIKDLTEILSIYVNDFAYEIANNIKNKLTESKIDKSVNKMLKEVSTSYIKKKYINKIYKAIQPLISRIHKDDNWQAVNETFGIIEQVIGSENDLKVWCENGGYWKRMGEFPNYKEYKFLITLNTEGIEINGSLKCHSAGTMEDTFSSYDITVTFW